MLSCLLHAYLLLVGAGGGFWDLASEVGTSSRAAAKVASSPSPPLRGFPI